VVAITNCSHEAIAGMKVPNFKGGPATKLLGVPRYNWTRLGTIERNESKMLERIARGQMMGKIS
jgi:hypothetical protein